MSDKALAYRVTVTSLIPIEGKDRIVLAEMQQTGFRCIVQKDEFKLGDQGIYFEVGSILPINNKFQFLEKRCYSSKLKGFKIKTMKMGECYSEGLLLPFSYLMDMIPPNKSYDPNDMTEIFGVRRLDDDVPQQEIQCNDTKFERFIKKWIYRLFKIKIKKQGFGAWDFPSELLPKTDETQVQSLKYIFSDSEAEGYGCKSMQGLPIYCTIKCDGQSATFTLKDRLFTVSSRNRMLYRANINKAIKILKPSAYENLKKISNHVAIAAKYNLPKMMKREALARGMSRIGFAIQGEICGPGIQKNRLGLKDYELFVFSVCDLTEKQFFIWDVLKSFCHNMKLQTVPFIEKRIFDWKNVNDLEHYAEQFKYDNGHPAEGVVIRSDPYNKFYITSPLYKMNAMCSFKIINPKFKLKTQDEE